MAEDRSDWPTAVVVGSVFPWWFLVAPKLGVRVSEVWYDYSSPLKSIVVSLLKEQRVDTFDLSKGRQEDLLGRSIGPSQVVLIELGIPWVLHYCLTLESVKLIVIGGGEGKPAKTPRGWHRMTLSMNHQRAGGVTDGTHRFSVYSRDPTYLRIKKVGQDRRPPQDLRSVLKMAVAGIRCEAPDPPPPVEPIGRVLQARPGVIWGFGLMPVGSCHLLRWPKVRTVFGGDYWVVRQLSLKERLQALDFPENLLNRMSSAQLDFLGSLSFAPIKARQAMMESLTPTFQALAMQDGKRKLTLEASRGTESKRLRFSEEDLTEFDLKPRIHPVAVLENVEDWADQERNQIASVLGERIPSGELGRDLKAAKEDKAPVPVELWDYFLLRKLPEWVKTRPWRKAVETLRRRMLYHWKRYIWKGLRVWIKTNHGSVGALSKSVKASIRDCMYRWGGATWWEWNCGSSPFFWNWPPEFQNVIRTGLPPWIKRDLRHWRRPQPEEKDAEVRKHVTDKLISVRERKYVEPGNVKSLISYFPVKKGKSDIRMVYDGTRSGLNDTLWAPWFLLPTVESLLRCVVPGTFMSDNDCGEMFLNFILHESVKEVCGIDLTPYFPEELRKVEGKQTTLWERWSRCAMGLKPSPYNAVQGITIALEMILGDSDNESNVFRWHEVILNLPGSPEYDPRFPKVYKARKDGTVAADVQGYVDDNRETAPTEFECWWAAQMVSGGLSFLGLQCAARKRRWVSLRSGAWAGSTCFTSDDRVVVLISEERWMKTKALLTRWFDAVDLGNDLDYKALESDRGTLIYVARTYPSMKPYLKGFHLTIDSYREGRDAEGWKIPVKSPAALRPKARRFDDADEAEFELRLKMREAEDNQSTEQAGEESASKKVGLPTVVPPKVVRAVPRFIDDLRALITLMEGDCPPLRVIRFSRRIQIVYGFGDASGKGFGSAILIDGRLYWKGGQWSVEVQKAETSNYKELCNLVLAIKRVAGTGVLAESEVIMFTDNSTAERAYLKGTSTNPDLFDLVLELRKVEMTAQCTISLVHVSGKRMIASGIDGISRGDYNTGVMVGDPLLSFVPLHLSAFDRSEKVKQWIFSWVAGGAGGRKTSFLSPSDWPRAHATGGCYVWAPPPAAADAAVEWLAKSIHKRPFSLHVFVVPRLMSAWWHKVLGKTTDVVLMLPVGVNEVWKDSEYEPLTIAIYFPLSKRSPWRHKGSPCLESLQESLPRMWKSRFERCGIVLRELVLRAWGMARLQWDVVP